MYGANSFKRKCGHFDEIFATGCTRSCQLDNFWWSRWQIFHQNDISILVLAQLTISLSWWHHQMEKFSALLALCVCRSPVNSHHKGQWRGALIFSLICTWTTDWVNDRDAGDLRCHHTHYDVTVMTHKFDPCSTLLTHLPLEPHIGICELGQHWFR